MPPKEPKRNHLLLGKTCVEVSDFTLIFGKVIEVTCNISGVSVCYAMPNGRTRWANENDLWFDKAHALDETKELWKIAESM